MALDSEQGVHHLIAFSNNDACRHTALIDVSGYPNVGEVPPFQRRAKCGKCGGKRVNVRPNWKEQPVRPTKLDYRWSSKDTSRKLKWC
jgi:hypothetical protein